MARAGDSRGRISHGPAPEVAILRSADRRLDATISDRCTAPGCDRRHKAKGYCRTHYGLLLRGARSHSPASPFEERAGPAVHGPWLRPIAGGPWALRDPLQPLSARRHTDGDPGAKASR